MRIAPSILSADFSCLAEEIARVEEAGAYQLHLDVMDGHYVDNLTFGPLVVEAVRRSTKLPLNAHLMIENADKWVGAFADAGADMIAIHADTLYHPHRCIQEIRRRDKRPGLALNPGIAPSTLEELLPDVDYVIVMSVNPGFGGQEFIPGSFDRVRSLRALARDRQWSLEIEIDGGIDLDNIGDAAKAGVDVAVAGSAVFRSDDPARTVREMSAATPSGSR
jgi:ribulose-phosphate 3-epimerase